MYKWEKKLDVEFIISLMIGKENYKSEKKIRPSKCFIIKV